MRCREDQAEFREIRARLRIREPSPGWPRHFSGKDGGKGLRGDDCKAAQSRSFWTLSKNFITWARSWPRLRIRPWVLTMEKAPCFWASFGFFSIW